MGAWFLPGEYPNRVDAARTDGFEALFGGAVLPRNPARGLDQGGVERGSAHPVGQAIHVALDTMVRCMGRNARARIAPCRARGSGPRQGG